MVIAVAGGRPFWHNLYAAYYHIPSKFQ